MIHHILNGNWHKNLLHGRYSQSRLFMLAIDALVFLSMIGLMISGIMLSNHVFAFLGIRGGMSFARLLHMALLLLGLCPDVAAFGASLGNAAGNDEKSVEDRKGMPVRRERLYFLSWER